MWQKKIDMYAYLLSGLACSGQARRAIVKKIRKIINEEDAIEFFEEVSHPLSIGRWLFYDRDAQRKAILGLRKYLRTLGVKAPAPDKQIRKWLDGGEYPK